MSSCLAFRRSVRCGLANSRGRPKQKVKHDGQCKYKRNIEVRLCDHFCREKAIGITYSECVLFLVFQHAKCIRHIMLLSVACVALPNFSALSHKCCNFQENSTDHKICGLVFFYNFCLKHFSL